MAGSGSTQCCHRKDKDLPQALLQRQPWNLEKGSATDPKRFSSSQNFPASFCFLCLALWGFGKARPTLQATSHRLCWDDRSTLIQQGASWVGGDVLAHVIWWFPLEFEEERHVVLGLTSRAKTPWFCSLKTNAFYILQQRKTDIILLIAPSIRAVRALCDETGAVRVSQTERDEVQ